MTQKSMRNLSSSGKKGHARILLTEGSYLLREHLAPTQQQMLYQNHQELPVTLLKGQNSILYPKGAKPAATQAAFQERVWHQQVSSPISLKEKHTRRQAIGYAGQIMVAQSAQNTSNNVRKSMSIQAAAADDWNKRHKLDNGRLRDLQTLRSTTQTTTKFNFNPTQQQQTRQHQLPQRQAQPYTRQAMQQRFSNRTYMRTEHDIPQQFHTTPTSPTHSTSKDGCINGQRQLQIKSINATPVPTKTLMVKHQQRYSGSACKEDVTSLQACLNELNKYQKDQARNSLNANLSSMIQTVAGCGISRNDAEKSATSNRFNTTVTGVAALHQQQLQEQPQPQQIQLPVKKISHHRRYYSGGAMNAMNALLDAQQLTTSTMQHTSATTASATPVRSPSPPSLRIQNEPIMQRMVKCHSQRKKSDLSIGHLSYSSHKKNGSHNFDLSVQQLTTINIDSDRNSHFSSIRTLRVDEDGSDLDGNDSELNDHFREGLKRMLPTICCENTDGKIQEASSIRKQSPNHN